MSAQASGSAVDAIKTELTKSRSEWERRLGAIRSDRRRESAPLENDFEEQAVQRIGLRSFGPIKK
jgi:hypothetical protein